MLNANLFQVRSRTTPEIGKHLSILSKNSYLCKVYFQMQAKMDKQIIKNIIIEKQKVLWRLLKSA